MKVEKSLLSFLYLNEIILHIYYIHVTKRLQKDYKIRTGKKRHTIFVQENTRNVNI